MCDYCGGHRLAWLSEHFAPHDIFDTLRVRFTPVRLEFRSRFSRKLRKMANGIHFAYSWGMSLTSSSLRVSALFSVFLGIASVAGCSDDTDKIDPPVKVTGTVAGITVPTDDSAGVMATFEPNTPGVNPSSEPITLMLIAVADKTNLCGYHSSPPNTTALSLILGVKGRAINPGTYNVSEAAINTDDAGTATYSLAGAFATTDGTCKATLGKKVLSGSVTLETVTANSVTGSFDVVLEDGSAKGEFTTSLCFTADEFTKVGASCGG